MPVPTPTSALSQAAVATTPGQVNLPAPAGAPALTPASAFVAAPAPVASAPLPSGTYGQQASAAMNPIFTDAAARQAANTDALGRALNEAQGNAAQSVASQGNAMNAPAGAVAAVSAIPQAALANIQNRALGLSDAQNAGLSAAQTDMTAGLANNLNLQGFAEAMAKAASQSKVNAINATAAAKASTTGGLTADQSMMLQLDMAKMAQAAQFHNDTLNTAQAKADAATQGAQAQFLEGNGTAGSGMYAAFSKLLDPVTGMPTQAGQTLPQLEKQFASSIQATAKAVGLDPVALQSALNDWRQAQFPQYALGTMTQSGKTVPILPTAPGTARTPQLNNALNDYQANRANGGASTMAEITKLFGPTIADQVRAAVASAGGPANYEAGVPTPIERGLKAAGSAMPGLAALRALFG